MIDNINDIFSNYTPYINGWENFKRASVIVPIVNYNGSLHILFEVRAETLRTQPNEICFPGGKIEKYETPLEAALRDTYEEIGIYEDKKTITAKCDSFLSFLLRFCSLLHFRYIICCFYSIIYTFTIR